MAAATLRIGILGAARIAPAGVVHPAERVEGVEVVGVAARDPRRAEAFAKEHGLERSFESYAELVASPEIDAVYVALPSGLHCGWSVRALRSGKHVLCEKPIASNAREAEQMAEASRESGRILMEGFHYRYHPVAERMLELARERLGAIESIEARFDVPIPDRSDIRWSYALGGGACMDLGCYPVHMVRHVVGEEPEVIAARAEATPDHIDVRMEGELRFPGGAEGRIACSMAADARVVARVHVRGERGRLTVTNPLAPHAYPHRIELEVDGETLRETRDAEATYTCQLRAFLVSVRDGTPPLTGPTDAIANMRVIDALYTRAGLPVRGAGSDAAPGS